MKVKDVIKFLEKCDPDSKVFIGNDVTGGDEVFDCMEINQATNCKPGVYILGE